MQIRQNITYSTRKDKEKEVVTGISKSYIYAPRIAAAPQMEMKWHEDVYRERKAV